MVFLESAETTPLIFHMHPGQPAEYDFYSHLVGIMCLLRNKVKDLPKLQNRQGKTLFNRKEP